MVRLSKPVTRRVHDRNWGELIVTLTAAGITVREFGKRHTWGPITYGTIALKGAELEGNARIAARRQKRRMPR